MNVIFLDLFLVLEPTSRILEAGSNTTLQCEAESQALLELTWTKDGRPLQLTTPTTKADNVYSNSITLEDVADEDSGNYTCRAFSSVLNRSIESSEATVTVFSKLAAQVAKWS